MGEMRMLRQKRSVHLHTLWAVKMKGMLSFGIRLGRRRNGLRSVGGRRVGDRNLARRLDAADFPLGLSNRRPDASSSGKEVTGRNWLVDSELRSTHAPI